MKHHSALWHSALRRYETWANALMAAGVDRRQVRPQQKSALAVLKVLRDVMQRSRPEVPTRLKLECAYYFGSYRKAVAALRTEKRLSRSWTRATVLRAIVQRYRSKQPLSYTAVRRSAARLVYAAQKQFRSWGRALAAARIDPTLCYRRPNGRSERQPRRCGKRRRGGKS
jgi:hypothetical protein